MRLLKVEGENSENSDSTSVDENNSKTRPRPPGLSVTQLMGISCATVSTVAIFIGFKMDNWMVEQHLTPRIGNTRGVKACPPPCPPLKIEKNGKILEILRVFEIFSGFLGVCPPPPKTRF